MVITEYSIDLRPRQSFSGADAVSATETAVAAAAVGAAETGAAAVSAAAAPEAFAAFLSLIHI